jgi:hypothetical protein
MTILLVATVFSGVSKTAEIRTLVPLYSSKGGNPRLNGIESITAVHAIRSTTSDQMTGSSRRIPRAGYAPLGISRSIVVLRVTVLY